MLTFKLWDNKLSLNRNFRVIVVTAKVYCFPGTETNDKEYGELGPNSPTNVRLRIFGQELDPFELTQLFDCIPDMASKVGDTRLSQKHMIHESTGRWILSA